MAPAQSTEWGAKALGRKAGTRSGWLTSGTVTFRSEWFSGKWAHKKLEKVLVPSIGKRAVGDLPAAGVGDIMEGTREKFVQNQPWLALHSQLRARLAQALSEGALTERNL